MFSAFLFLLFFYNIYHKQTVCRNSYVEIKKPILSAHKIGNARKSNPFRLGASTFGVGAFPMSNITQGMRDFNHNLNLFTYRISFFTDFRCGISFRINCFFQRSSNGIE